MFLMKLMLQIFILGLIFERILPVSSVKCYLCKEPECMDYKKDGTKIDCKHGCERIKGRRRTGRGCAKDAIDVECLKKELNGCMDNSKPGHLGIIHDCRLKADTMTTVQSNPKTAEEVGQFRCVCTEDLCNGEIDLKSGGTGGVGGTRGTNGTAATNGTGNATIITEDNTGNNTGGSLGSDKYFGYFSVFFGTAVAAAGIIKV